MRIVRCTGSRVQIAPQPATTYKRLVFSYLESFSVACSFVAGSIHHKGHRGH
jgi:hypothetical protein